MSKILLSVVTLVVAVLFSALSFGQSFYFSASPELRSAAQKAYLGESIKTNYHSSTGTIQEDYQQVITSLGNGYQLSAAAGYQVNNFLSFELEAGYLLSEDVAFYDDFDFIGQFIDEIDFVYSAQTFSVTPTISARVPDRQFSPFISLGFVMAFPQLTLTSKGSYQIDEDEMFVREYQTRLTPGAQIKGGLEWQMGVQMALVGSVGFTGYTFKPKSSEITKWDVGGRDELGSLTDAQRVSNYSETYTVSYQFDPLTGELVEDEEELIDIVQPAVQFPFSSVSFGLGIKYYLTSRKVPTSPILN